MLLTITISAGQTVEFHEAGDFFRLMQSNAAVNVKFFQGGSELVDSPGVNAGYCEKFRDSFTRIQIYSGTSQTIQFVSRLGNEVSYDGAVSLVGGSVAISNMAGAFTSAAVTVTNASTTISTAKARRYLAIQNNDSAAIAYINLAGGTATTSNSIKLPAGASLIIDSYCPSNLITAIGSVASNANVVLVEG